MVALGLTTGFRSSTLGIEITDHDVKICEVQAAKNVIRIKNHVRVPLPEGVMNDGRLEDPEQLRQTMRKALDAKKWGTKTVHFAVPSQLAMVRLLRMPDVPQRAMKKLMDFECTNNIHFPFDDPHYDFVKLKRKESPMAPPISEPADPERETQGEARLCDVMLVAASRSVLNQYVSLFSDLKLHIKCMDLKAFSLLRLAERMNLAEPERTVLMVDVNASSCDLSIIFNNEIQITRNIPSTFGKSQSAGNDELDQWFAEFSGNSSDFENASQELISEMERLINFYRYTLNKRDKEIEDIWVSGDLDDMDRLLSLMSERMNRPVRPMMWDFHGMDDKQTAVFATTIGLGLRGGK